MKGNRNACEVWQTVRALRERADIGEVLEQRALGENALRFYGMGATVTAGQDSP
jgi:hypothetical protein